MIWFCAWADRASLIVDHSKREGAIAIATEMAEGEAPAHVVLVPEGVFRAEVVDDGGDSVLVDVDEGTLYVLTELEDREDGPPSLPCPSFAVSDDGGRVVCARAKGHAGDHESSDASLEWS